MASDRRLTVGRKIETDAQDKMCVVMTDDARAVLSFSGLAKFGNLDFHNWLIDKFTECGEPDFQLPNILNRLKGKLDNELFSATDAKRLGNSQRALSIHVAGFRYVPSVLHVTGIEPLPFYVMLSNYEKPVGGGDPSTPSAFFESSVFLPTVGVARCKLCAAIGNTRAISHSDLKEIGEQAYYISDRAVALKLKAAIISSSKSPLSASTVGGKVSTVVVPADRDQSVVGDFHSDDLSLKYYQPASVICTSTGGIAIKRMSVHYGGVKPPVMVVPQVAKKAPCPCGSRKRYKDCHGKNHAQQR